MLMYCTLCLFKRRPFTHFDVVPLQRKALDHRELRLQVWVLKCLGVVALHPQLFYDLFCRVHLNWLWLDHPNFRNVPDVIGKGEKY